MRVRAALMMCVLSLAVVLVARGGGASAAASAPAPLSIDSPGDHERVDWPITMVFETKANLDKLLNGSAPDPYADPTAPVVYLHIGWDGTVIMPTPSQIAVVGPNTYAFVQFPRMGPGFHELEIFWGDAKTHHPVGRVVSVLCNVTLN